MGQARTITRRRLLMSGAVISVTGPTLNEGMPWTEGAASYPQAAIRPPPSKSYVYFNPAEAAFVEAAVARLIPADDLGPGAVEAGAAFFIDSQLAGEFGRAERWYMQGPWAQG